MKKYNYKNYELTKEDISEKFGTIHKTSILKNSELVYEKFSYSFEINVPENIASTIIENIYTPDGNYLINTMQNSEGSRYFPNEVLEKEAKLSDKQNALIESQKFNKVYKLSKKSNGIVIEKNDIPCTSNNDLLTEFRTLRNEYRSLDNTIEYRVAKASLIDAQKLIHSYITVGSLDVAALNLILSNLSNVSDVVSNSYTLLQDFMKNPQNSDLRNLDGLISKSIKNLNTILELKFEKEPNKE